MITRIMVKGSLKFGEYLEELPSNPKIQTNLPKR
jgi:hypothetical protein